MDSGSSGESPTADSIPEWVVGDYRNEAAVYNCDCRPVALNNMYRGATAFLVGSGPSLVDMDLSLFNRRGVISMCMNNSVSVIRPQLWCCVDSPTRWIEQLWPDPGILKFVPYEHMGQRTRRWDANGKLVASTPVGHHPAVFGYKLNCRFNAATFLTEPTFNWGCHANTADDAGVKSYRSVILPSLKMLYFLGFRTVNLVGVDFKMPYSQPYAFDETKSRGGVNYNNNMYKVLGDRFTRLKPHFEAAGMKIRNCTPNSGLTVFPKLSFEQAVQEASAVSSAGIKTRGLYH